MASPGSLLPAILPGALAFLLFVFAGAKHTLVGINSDAAVYVLMADIYSPYRPHDIGFSDHLFASYPFPPLFPLTLGALGGGTAAPWLDYVIGAALLGVAVGGICGWVRRAGGSSGAALVCAMAFALTPSALLVAMGVFSEPLYLALSMSAFAVLATPQKKARHWYAAGLLFGLAALARTVGVFAIAAFLVYWWSRTRGRSCRAVLWLTLLPTAAWSLIKWLHGWHAAYTTSLLEAGLRPALLDIWRQLPINAQALWYYAVRTFDLLGSSYSAAACSMLLLLAGISLIQRLRELEADAIYVVLYVTLLLLWPYPNDDGRFLLVLLPFLLAYMLWGARTLVRAGGSTRLAPAGEAAIALVLACIILPSTLLITQQIRQFADGADADKVKTASWYGHDRQAEARAAFEFSMQVLAAMRALEPFVPRDVCVTSTMPEMVQLQIRRRSIRPPATDAGPAAMHAALARCPYVLMLRATAFPNIAYPFYYPLSAVITHLQVLHSVALRPPSTDGQPLAILARYVPAASPSAAAAATPTVP